MFRGFKKCLKASMFKHLVVIWYSTPRYWQYTSQVYTTTICLSVDIPYRVSQQAMPIAMAGVEVSCVRKVMREQLCTMPALEMNRVNKNRAVLPF